VKLVPADIARRRAVGQILLLVAGFLVLVAISASSVILVNQAREDNAWVVHTVEVENQISTVLLEIRRAESAARGYLLTSQPQFLAEHETAVAAVRPAVDNLTHQAGDNPVQIENGKQLRPLV
jgi:CHASE3 domain sensor protein